MSSLLKGSWRQSFSSVGPKRDGVTIGEKTDWVGYNPSNKFSLNKPQIIGAQRGGGGWAVTVKRRGGVHSSMREKKDGWLNGDRLRATLAWVSINKRNQSTVISCQWLAA